MKSYPHVGIKIILGADHGSCSVTSRAILPLVTCVIIENNSLFKILSEN